MKRPVIVTIIGVLGIISGIGQAIFGAVVIGMRNKATFLDEANLKAGSALAIGVVFLIVGILTFVFALGLLKGSRVARGLLGISEVAQLAAGIYGVAALGSSHRASAISTIVGALIVLYFLFGTDKAKAFFAKS